MPAPMIALMALVASATDSKTPSMVRHTLRIARQPHPRLGDNGQRPLAADNETGQVQARVVFGGAAEFDQRPVGQHSLDPQHVIDRHAVLERVRPAGIRGHVAANCAGALARRIGRVMISGPLQAPVSATR